MPLDEQQNKLLSAFSKPVGETDGPQVFEMKCCPLTSSGYVLEAVEDTANTLGMNIRTHIKDDNQTIFIAVECAEDYTILFNAMGSKLRAALDLLREHNEERLRAYNEVIAEYGFDEEDLVRAYNERMNRRTLKKTLEC